MTGGASGIGLAAATKLASMGLRIVAVDHVGDKLTKAAEVLRAAGATEVITSAIDVADRSQVEALEVEVTRRFGGTDVLMNNTGFGGRSSCFGTFDAWEKILGVNLWGAVNGLQAFAPGMIARGRPGAITNTGSKQGITTPPGNPAYNVSKAGLKAFTEALAHELRNAEGAQISVHLLIPGFVHTGMIGAAERPPAAWIAEQTVDFFVESMNRGDFDILCPDNDVPRALDEKRIAWAVGDIIENRPRSADGTRTIRRHSPRT